MMDGAISQPWERVVDSQFYDCHRAPLHDGWMRGRKPGNWGGRRGVIGRGDGHRLQGYHTEIQEKATFFFSRSARNAPISSKKPRDDDEKHERASEQELHKLAARDARQHAITCTHRFYIQEAPSCPRGRQTSILISSRSVR